MERKHIITIAGRPGSGKSTTAKQIAAQLGYQHFSSGDLFRMLASERGIDVLQANVSAEQNAELDHMVDGRLQEMGTEEDRLVVDSRMAWHWMPQSFKVFLDLDLTIAAERILNSLDEARRISEHVLETPAAYAAQLAERLASETRRYKALYKVNPYELSQYDLVVDTAENGPDAVVKRILKEFTLWVQENKTV